MEKNCFNKITLIGEWTKLQKINIKLKSNTTFNHSNLKNLFDSDVSDIQEEDWGSESFEINKYYFEGKTLIITGYSYLSPLIGLCETLSAEWDLESTLEYEEPKYDFAGKITFDNSGIVKESLGWFYWEKVFLYDYNSFLQEAILQMNVYDTFEQFIESFHISLWKVKPDLNDLMQLWSTNR